MGNEQTEAAREELRQFSVDVEAFGATNLETLRKINTTVDWLVRIRAILIANSKYADKAVAVVRDGHGDNEIDPDDKIADRLEAGVKGLAALHILLKARLASVVGASKLDGAHKSTLIDEYEHTIECVSQFHGVAEELRWAIMEHDGRASGIGATASTAQDLDKIFS